MLNDKNQELIVDETFKTLSGMKQVFNAVLEDLKKEISQPFYLLKPTIYSFDREGTDGVYQKIWIVKYLPSGSSDRYGEGIYGEGPTLESAVKSFNAKFG